MKKPYDIEPMKIKVDDAQVQAVLDEVQARARVRTISADDVRAMCATVTERLSISKAALDGVAFSADFNAQAFPGAYKGAPESTVISCEYHRGAWYMTNASRDYCRRPAVAYVVNLTEAAEKAILARCARFGA